MIFYVPVNPGGHRLDAYASPSEWECWTRIFDVCFSDADDEWRRKYWHKVGPFKRWAKKQGWQIVKCKLVEA